MSMLKAHEGPPLHEGVAITLGGVVYTLPPCSLATLKRHAKGIDTFARSQTFALNDEAVDTILSVIHEALRRNYLDITQDFIAENLGVDVIMETFQAAMDVSGLMRKSKAPSLTGTTSEAAGEGGTLGESTGTA